MNGIRIKSSFFSFAKWTKYRWLLVVWRNVKSYIGFISLFIKALTAFTSLRASFPINCTIDTYNYMFIYNYIMKIGIVLESKSKKMFFIKSL